ncbi:hypothetical protein R6Q57_009228 [Mikania cordata]
MTKSIRDQMKTKEKIFKKKLDAERRGISKLKELLSDKESNYRDPRCQIDEISLELEKSKTELSKTKIIVEKYEYVSNVVAKLVDVENRGKETIGLGFTKCVDDLLLKLDRWFEFTSGSSKQVPLIADPVLTDSNSSENSEVCAESSSVTGRREKEEERSASRSTNCSTSSSKSHFVPKVDFVERFETIKIKPNEMFKNFKTNFVNTSDDVKNKCVLESDSSSLTEHVNQA